MRRPAADTRYDAARALYSKNGPELIGVKFTKDFGMDEAENKRTGVAVAHNPAEELQPVLPPGRPAAEASAAAEPAKAEMRMAAKAKAAKAKAAKAKADVSTFDVEYEDDGEEPKRETISLIQVSRTARGRLPYTNARHYC